MNILNQNSTIITFDQLTTQAEDYYLTSKQALELLLKSSLNNYQINYAALFLLCFLLLVSYFVFSDRRKSKASYYAYRETKLNKAIVNALQSNVPEYNYPWWYNSHLGSIIPFGHDPDLQYERQIFTNYDESCFAVDWYPHKPPTTLTSCNEALKICLFLPGLGLSSRSKFCQKFVESIAKEGYISAVVNASGVEIPLKNSKFWHPGHYHDAKTVLNYIYNNYHRSEDNVKCHVYLVGFSAGSNIIHKLIINNKRKDFLKAALGVCIGGDYVKARMHLESSFAGKLYSYLITYGHKDIITKNEHIHSHIGDSTIKKLLSCKFTSEFDSMAWESLYGLSSETEYYDMISSRYDDSRLNIPYLAIQPQDDPLHQVINTLMLSLQCNNAYIALHSG